MHQEVGGHCNGFVTYMESVGDVAGEDFGFPHHPILHMYKKPVMSGTAYLLMEYDTRIIVDIWVEENND